MGDVLAYFLKQVERYRFISVKYVPSVPADGPFHTSESGFPTRSLDHPSAQIPVERKVKSRLEEGSEDGRSLLAGEW